MSGITLFWLLLPVAAISGWWLGRSGDARKAMRDDGGPGIESRYFRGINYLLNEQPDQAVDVFIELLEVGSETAETHLALGGLYRRRGEVDRAIRIHQNLVAQPDLPAEQKSEALLELAQDYQSAGLLDRAEDLFRELADSNLHKVQALRQLIDIYEHERDWDKAIEAARDLEAATGNQLGSVIAHYHCEIAEVHRGAGREAQALAALSDAVRAHPACVRASLLEGDIHAEGGAYQRALSAYRQVERQDQAYVQETVAKVARCYAAINDSGAASDYLSTLVERDGDPTATLALTEVKLVSEGPDKASEFLLAQLKRRLSLRGLHRLLELEMKGGVGLDDHTLEVFGDLTEQLLAERSAYQCDHCGFPARYLHWQCPSCKHWNSVRPTDAVDGDWPGSNTNRLR